jgi:hypothetical protein
VGEFLVAKGGGIGVAIRDPLARGAREFGSGFAPGDWAL